MEVLVLGEVEVVGTSGERISVPGSKMRGLVATLALDAGRTVSTQRLIDSLWGEQEVSGPNVVHVVVSKFRRLLADIGESDTIVTFPTGYQLRVDSDAVDALRFETLTVEAHDSDPTDVVARISRALDLWRGDALAGAPDTALIGAMRARLHELRQVAVEDLVDAQLALGQHHHLSSRVEALVAEEPLRERRWCQLIRALYGAGRQADALRAFQRARETLIDQIGVEPGVELRQLEAAVLAQDASLLGTVDPPRTDAPVGEGFRRRGNVRHPVGRCVGREDALDVLASLASQQRLVTLTGPGGVGKTRLAMELAVALQSCTPDGVWWIDLAAARSEADILAATQRSLRMEPVGGADPQAAIDAVVAALGDSTAVLVLDNCEHLLSELTPVVEDLLGRGGGLRVLATSRERLGIAGEAVFAVDPLSPAAAVALFETLVPGATGEHDGVSDTVARICERLDRLPLALELAAARARHLRLEELLERLTDRFDVLPDGLPTAQPHQRNLRAVADWSYELLDEPERRVFERLSVFADGATLDAATQVCTTPGVSPLELERVLVRLVDRSLIVADLSGPNTRYRMLQTLADYASERLDARGDRHAARRAHALWVRDLAGTVRFGASTTGTTVAAVQDEDVAIRHAVRWALVEEPWLALDICAELSTFWFGTMRVSVGWELLSAALDAASGDDPLRRGSALAWATVFATMVEDTELAHRHWSEAVVVERAHGDPARLGLLSVALALASGYRRHDEAYEWVEAARASFAAASMPIGLGYVSFAEGALHLVDGHHDEAASCLREAIAVFRRERDQLGLILGVSRLGELAWRLGDLALFTEMHAFLLELGREGRSAGVVTGATARLALGRLLEGDLEDAQQLARAALASSGETFMPVVNGYAFKTAGLVDLASGHVTEGRRHLHAAIEAFEVGTGSLGAGQAALCWVDLSRSHLDAGEVDEGRHAAEVAIEIGRATGDPWVREQTEAHLAQLSPLAAPPGSS